MEDDVVGVPEWVVTYGDMMSLLLTFFIMLVSMSELKEEGKNRAMLDAIREAFGATISDASGVPGRSLQTTSAFNKLRSEGMRSQGGIKQANRDSKGHGGAESTVSTVSRGDVITLGGPVLFGRFDVELSPESQRHLEIVASAIQHKPHQILVRGHASPEPLPTDGPFRNAMELSFERATRVIASLIAQGIPANRIVLEAVGDSEPRFATNDQTYNRRVDIFLLDPMGQ